MYPCHFAVLAGIAGALPFVGPYWISLPAALELWLIDSRPLAAIILMVLSVLPVLFIDSIINGEIEGYVSNDGEISLTN